MLMVTQLHRLVRQWQTLAELLNDLHHLLMERSCLRPDLAASGQKQQTDFAGAVVGVNKTVLRFVITWIVKKQDLVLGLKAEGFRVVTHHRQFVVGNKAYVAQTCLLAQCEKQLAKVFVATGLIVILCQ